jgi:homoserine O-acetyltransferase/O-succinyltransferase
VNEETVAIGALDLECGATLPAVDQHVTIYGSPRADGSNVAFVAHALTGSSRVAQWWPNIVGEDALFDTRRWCAIGVNALGSCYGSTGPASQPSEERFPQISVGDIVAAAMRALERIGIPRIRVAIGGSLGGMQALQWALAAPDRIECAVMVGAHDHHSAMGIALNAIQREALELDPARGLRLARKIAMLSYKSDDLLRRRHDRRRDRLGRSCFDVEGYLEHQADLFEERMDAATYASLTHAMDSFDVRDAQPTHAGASPRFIFVGVSSDWLFRPQDVRAAAERFARRGFNASYHELTSDHGHDAFLADPRALRILLEPLVS